VPDVPPEDRILTPAEAAAVLGLTVKDLYALEARGKLRARVRTLGGHRRFREDDVRALREKLDLLGAAPKETLTSREAADLLRVAPKTVGKWARNKKIECTWTDKHRLQVPVAEVERLLREGGAA
jgi:excisionase family DNA binding protein